MNCDLKENDMFVNDIGFIRLAKPFPKRMTWKKALELSIKKWEFILSERKAGNHIHGNGVCDTCALCHRANSSCGDCPVYKKTGFSQCRKTPYTRAVASRYAVEDVQAEIDFLKSL